MCMNGNRHNHAGDEGQSMRISIDAEETDRTAEEWQELLEEYMMQPAQPHVAS